jgi:SPP1 gp7 family putative phage head morphogenesis protein
MKKRSINVKQFFQPIISATRDFITKNILTKALDYNSGLEYKLQNPDRILGTTNKDLTLYDLMLMDDKIKNTLEIFKKMTTACGGSFVGASDDPIDKEISTFVEDILNSMSIRFWDVFDNLLDARAYGFKCGELIWVVEDGKVILKNIKFKHSLFFDFEYDDFADLKTVKVGYRNAQNVDVPVEEFNKKFIYFVNPYLKDQNYYGESDLMAVYEPWRSKTQITKFRNIYLQNYGFPIPICIYEKLTASEKETLDNQLENFQEQMYFLIPGVRDSSGKLNGKIDIQFHKAETTGGAASFSDSIDQIDKQISRKLLIPDKAGFSESAGGSYNLGEQQFDALKLFIQDYKGRLEDAINKVIKCIVDFNFTVEKYPEWKFESDDSKISEAMLKILVDTGIIDKREKWIRPYIGIPTLTEEEQTEIDDAKDKDNINNPIVQSGGFPHKKSEHDEEIKFNWITTESGNHIFVGGESYSDIEGGGFKPSLYSEEKKNYISSNNEKAFSQYNAGIKLKEDIEKEYPGLTSKSEEHIARTVLYGDNKKLSDDYSSYTMAHPERYAIMTAGFKGEEIPPVKIGWRYGDIPESGASRNYRDQKAENGVSVMQIEGGAINKGFAGAGHSKNKTVINIVVGRHIGTGSDGEDLLVGVKHIRKITADKKNKKQKFKYEIPCNFKKIKGQYDTYEEEFISDYKKIMFSNQLAVIKQIKSKQIIENNDMSLIKALRIPKTEIKDLFSMYFAKLYLSAKGDSIDEIESRLEKTKKKLLKNDYIEFKPSNDELWVDREWVDKYLKKYGDLGILSKKDKQYLKNYREKAFYISGETEQEVLSTVQNTISSGIRNGLQTSVIIGKIQDNLSSDTEKYALTIARTNASDVYNSGRMNLFMDEKISPFIEAYQFSAIIDDVTTEFCEQHDGQIIYPSDPEFLTVNPPCHYNCRSLLIPIMVGDSENPGDYYEGYEDKFKPWGTGVTKDARKPAEGFGG